MTTKPSDEKKYRIDDPARVRIIYIGLWIVCGITVVADLFYHKHVHFPWEKAPGFHGWYALVGCALLVLIAKGLRRILMRGEDYYDD